MMICDKNGAWAGRLGNGLQNHVERFDSARHLKRLSVMRVFFYFYKFVSTSSVVVAFLSQQSNMKTFVELLVY